MLTRRFPSYLQYKTIQTKDQKGFIAAMSVTLEPQEKNTIYIVTCYVNKKSVVIIEFDNVFGSPNYFFIVV